jgi:hypothetical protein
MPSVRLKQTAFRKQNESGKIGLGAKVLWLDRCFIPVQSVLITRRDPQSSQRVLHAKAALAGLDEVDLGRDVAVRWVESDGLVVADQIHVRKGMLDTCWGSSKARGADWLSYFEHCWLGTFEHRPAHNLITCST